MKRAAISLSTILLLGAAGSQLLGRPLPARAHDAHVKFSAGEPGDPKKPARTIKVSMQENGKKMLFEPAMLEVRKGEQVRFVLSNDGTYNHEFMLGTRPENQKHAAVMKKHPEMEHDDANARRLAPFNSGELVWRFTRRGEFEYACLIPGHYEAGMHGKIVVK